MPLYVDGRRRILPPLVFGIGVLWHLIRHGRRYHVVHTASFPYFSLLAAAFVRPLARYRVVVDWHELWTRDYWREYLGPFGGWFGWKVQQLCLRVPQRAFCFSRLVEQRLAAERVHGGVTVLEGQFEGKPAAAPLPAEPVVVFVGRHIPEKDPVARRACGREGAGDDPGSARRDLRRRPRAPEGAGRDRRARARGRGRGSRLRGRGGDRGRTRARSLPPPPFPARGLRPRSGRGALEGDSGRPRPRRRQRRRGVRRRGEERIPRAERRRRRSRRSDRWCRRAAEQSSALRRSPGSATTARDSRCTIPWRSCGAPTRCGCEPCASPDRRPPRAPSVVERASRDHDGGAHRYT